MATKFKGICKGLKYISQIFAVKDREMEIGFPTDVKHVAHIGWDGASDTPPSWMSEFKPGPDFNTSFGGNPRENNSLASDPWSSQDGDQSKGSGTYRDSPTSTDVSSTTKRRRKKKKLSSSSMSNSSVSSRRSTKSKYSQTEPTLSLQV